MLRANISPFAGGADSSGYLNSARMFSEGQLLSPVRSIAGHGAADFGPRVHQSLGFSIKEGTPWMAPTYPIGYPLHLVAFSPIAGMDWAAIPLNIATAFACAGLMYRLARQVGLSRTDSVIGAVLLAGSPMFLFSALQPMSDALAVAWSLAALSAALEAKESRNWALFCGGAVAMSVLVRPTNLLLLIPIAVALRGYWRKLAWVGLGGIPGAIVLAYYNYHVYGSPFSTGYGEVSGAFSQEYVLKNVLHFARWLPLLITPIAVAALLAPLVPSMRRRRFAILGSWGVAVIGFYAFYRHSGEHWWYLRFLLPVFPALIIIGLAALRLLLANARPEWVISVTVLLGGLVWQGALVTRLPVFENKQLEKTYPLAAEWLQTNLPAGSPVVCMQVSGAITYYTDMVPVRWDWLEPDQLSKFWDALKRQRIPLHAALYDFEQSDAMAQISGKWERITTVGNVTIWRIEPAND